MVGVRGEERRPYIPFPQLALAPRFQFYFQSFNLILISLYAVHRYVELLITSRELFSYKKKTFSLNGESGYKLKVGESEYARCTVNTVQTT